MPQLAEPHQLTINFEPGLVERHKRLVDCIRECVLSHRNPLKVIAADMDLSQSDLSRRLSPSDKDRRCFSVDDLENYIATQRDTTPILYLIEKYLENPEHRKVRAVEALAKLMPLVEAALSQMDADTGGGKIKAVK